MLKLRGCLVLMVCLTLLRNGPAWGDQIKGEVKPAPEEEKSLGKDQYGDPLPGRAVARLGTVRFRVGEYLSGAALSPDGKVLAMVSGRQGIHLLDPATGKEMRGLKIEDPTGSRFFVFSPDSKMLASVGHIGQIALWSIPSGTLIRHIGTQGRHRTASFAFSANGKVLVAADEFSQEKGSARAWEVETGKQLGQFDILHNLRCSVAVSPDGKSAATCGQAHNFARVRKGKEENVNGIIQIWNVATGKESRRLITDWHFVSQVLYSPDGKTLATLGGNGAIGLWDAATGKPVRRIGCRHDIGALTFAADGKFLAGHSQQSAVIQVWETGTGKRLPLCRGPNCAVSSVAFAGKGKILACGVSNQAVYVWEVPGGKRLSPTKGHAGAVTSVAFAADGKHLLSASSGGTVCRWETATGKEVRQFTLRVTDDNMRHFYHYGNTSLSLSPDGKHAVMGTRHYGTPMLWDVAAGEEVCALGDLGNRIGESVHAFSPTGRLLALGGGDRFGRQQEAVLIIWDVHTCQEVKRLKGHQGGIHSVAFSPDGNLLASASSSIGRAMVQEVFLWSLRTGKKIGEIKNETNGQQALALSADGKILAVTNNQGITLWDTVTLKQTQALDTAQEFPNGSLAFSPDSRTVAAGTYNQQTSATTLYLWEVASGKLRCRFKGHRGMITALSFSPDGRLLASGSNDTTILLWDVTGRTWSSVPPQAHLAAKELAGLWTDLAGAEAKTGFAALVQLAAAPQDTVAFLHKELQPKAKPKLDAAGIAKLIVDLNDAQYKVRKKASRELELLGLDAKPAFLQALAGKPSAEVRRRVEQLLTKAETARLRVDPLLLRSLRALEVLERIATPEARQVLQGLAKGNPQARLTEEAGAVLRRLAKRSTSKP